MAIKRDQKDSDRLNDARTLVREVLVTDLGQPVSKRKINEAADKVLRALPEKYDAQEEHA